MSFPPFPPPPAMQVPYNYIPLSVATVKISIPGELLESSINRMIKSGEIIIAQNNIKRLDNNLLQITRWLNYEIDDKELYERIIEDDE